jgi:hypothetical protein
VPRPRLLSPIAYARRQGVYKGLLGGSRGWLTVGGFFWALRFLKKFMGKNEEVAATEVLKPGQAVTIIAIPPEKASKRGKPPK